VCLNYAPADSPSEKLYLKLQQKARLSYKQLQRKEGNVRNLGFAFFYVNKLAVIENKVLFPTMASLRNKGRMYNLQWVCYNQPLTFDSQRPSVLVVADEIFMMPDDRLLQKSRYSCPNTFQETKQGQLLNPK
jgi:hypothetical protein